MASHEADHVSSEEMSNMLKLEYWGFQHNYYPNGRESNICVPINDRLLYDNTQKDEPAFWGYEWTANKRREEMKNGKESGEDHK